MSEIPVLPLYYEGQSLADMEAALRRNYLTESGWLESARAKLSQRAGKPLPWFTYGAIEFLERELTNAQSLFEFGGGQSTLYWAERLRAVVGVDHDPSFAAHVGAVLPDNAQLLLIEENAPLSDNLAKWLPDVPDLSDPERSEKTFRSGQLNGLFRQYALSLLDQPSEAFDVVVIDGMARVLSTWSAIRYFKQKGFIVFDNSDRVFYQRGYDMLEQSGYRRIDFWGMGPVNPYQWCTSVFYQPERFLSTRWFDLSQSRPVSPPFKGCLGILVIGFNRPLHLQAVLESLRLQGRIGDVHLWIDGTQGRGEYLEANARTIHIAKRYPLKELRIQRSHLGIEKLMLDALGDMSARYERVLVLEDDCFPVEGAVDAFEHELAAIANNSEIYSVYGHHFGTEPWTSQEFTRFQGWGWAAHSHQIRLLLPMLRELFLMDEQSYLEHVARRLTREVRERLDVTPGRDVLNVLRQFFSWDSATALLTASLGLSHRRTRERTIVNTGIIAKIGHFRQDEPCLRAAPFNMITLDEAWNHFDRSTNPCNYSEESYGIDALDRIIIDAIPSKPGFFIEIGAYDGVTQSNSVLLEARGWRGLLIEANPGSYARAVRARPKAFVEHAACVGFEFEPKWTTITDVGLMSMTSESLMDSATRAEWLKRGEGFSKRARQEIDVPTTTISALLDKHAVERVDLLLLDVEGAEIEVLKGIDFERHAPIHIVAEDAYDERVADFLKPRGYIRSHVLLERKFTRDCLYIRTV